MPSELAERLDARTFYEPNTGCWIWLGTDNGAGYGSISYQGKHQLVHRLTYLLEVGPIPGGLDLDHLCRVRRCRSPYHLEPVTRSENLRRGVLWQCGESHRRQTHCPHGHEYDGRNSRGERVCRACRRVAMQRYRERHRV